MRVSSYKNVKVNLLKYKKIEKNKRVYLEN